MISDRPSPTAPAPTEGNEPLYWLDANLKRRALDDVLKDSRYGGAVKKEFQQGMENCVGICVTFNQSTDFGNDPQDSDGDSHVAVRVLCAHFVDTQKLTFKDFHTMLSGSCIPSLLKVLRMVLEDIEDRHVVLCVDEIKLMAKSGKAEDLTKIQVAVSALGVLLETERRVHVLVSSLDYYAVYQDLQTMSRRAINLIHLPLLQREERG